MNTVKTIARIILVSLVTLALAFGALEVAPVQAQTPVGLRPADWKQIRALLPAAAIDAQQAYVKASNTDAEDNFGAAIAISGDTLVVGAPYEASSATGVNGDQGDNTASNSGAVYVFTRNGSVWSQQAYIKASNAEAYDDFGSSVAISGDTLVVGAYGESSNATGVDGNQTDNSADLSGAVYVFTRSSGIWSQQSYIKSSNTGANDYFGGSVAISGDTLVVGAVGEASNATGVNGSQDDNSVYDSGAAYVFTRSGTTWSQQAYLKASNTGESDWFGGLVTISGDTLAVGAAGEGSNATGVNGDQNNNLASDSGAAYVFTRSGSNWSQQAYIKASNTSKNDQFGSVAISGDTLVVGAPGEDSSATGINGDQTDNWATDSGAAYVFTRSGSDWSQQAYLKESNTAQGDGFGGAVAISGEKLVVGAGDETAYVFARNGNDWGQQIYLQASNADAQDSFGYSVSIAGDTVAAGAPHEASNATGINGDQLDNSAMRSGAAYISVIPPLVMSSLPADANPTTATSLHFTVTFSEAMTGVDASDFALVPGGGVTGASITDVSSGPAAVYTVTADAGSGDGTIRLDVMDDDSIVNAASTPLGGTGTGNGDFTGLVYTIDRTTPIVLSITREDPNPTNADSVKFAVIFSKPVTGVDPTDFHLTTSGVTGATVADVSGSDDFRHVTVNTGLHPGVIRLELVDDDSIVNAASTPLGGAGAGNGNFAGQAYSINRTYTVTFKSIAAQDGWILESSENSNKGGSMNSTATTFRLGDDAANRQYRAIVSFDTGSMLPANAVIKSALLQIKQAGAPVGGNPFNILGKLWADIRKGTFGATALQLTDFSAPASALRVGYFNKTPSVGWYTNNLNAAGLRNINKFGLTQLRLYFATDDNNDHKANYMKFECANYPDPQPATLTITYSVP
ncbi:MAG: FG-GAP repeat protein [Anaerolineales bacterium]